MLRALLVAVLLALVVAAPIGGLAQEATPAPGTSWPLTPDPASCTVEPIDAAGLLALVPEGGEVPTAPPNVYPDPFVLQGAPAEAETEAAVTAALVQLLACFNAGDTLRIFALTSLRGLLDPEVFGPPPGATREQAAAQLEQLAAEGASPLPEGERITILDVLAVRVLDDGRVGVLHADVSPGDEEAPGPRLVYTLWALENGAWKFDGSLPDPYGMAAAAQTSATMEPEASAGIEDLAAGLGLPELVVRVDGDAYELSQTSIPAGRTLIRLENVNAEESWHGFLLRLPDGVTFEEALAAGGGEEGPPPVLFESTFPGFPGEALPGQTQLAVVDLTPGEYVIVGDVPQPFTVTGAAASPAAGGAPEAAAEVRLFEFGFEIPDGLAAGPQIWAVTNAGAAPHELMIVRSAVPITASPEELASAFMGEGGGDGVPSEAELTAAGGIGWLSPGATGWTLLDLEPGTYIVVCWVPDPETFEPHVAMGMIDTFTVE